MSGVRSERRRKACPTSGWSCMQYLRRRARTVTLNVRKFPNLEMPPSPFRVQRGQRHFERRAPGRRQRACTCLRLWRYWGRSSGCGRGCCTLRAEGEPNAGGCIVPPFIDIRRAYSNFVCDKSRMFAAGGDEVFWVGISNVRVGVSQYVGGYAQPVGGLKPHPEQQRTQFSALKPPGTYIDWRMPNIGCLAGSFDFPRERVVFH